MHEPISASAMAKLLATARLVSERAASAYWSEWQSSAEDPEDGDGFRRFLIDKRVLTVYQGALVLLGRTDGYFVGPYCILDRLGRGRMAGVYRARAATGKEVALKVLPPSKAVNGKLLARFQREARLLKELRHPNVVRCLDYGEAQGLNYIAMECLNGETLADVLQRRQRLGVAEAVRIVVETLQGLQHLHEKGMIHRDLKPGNLMLIPPEDGSGREHTLDCRVVILDVGLGRRVWHANQPDADQETQLTSEGVLLGTPDYWAPEQARDSHSVDIRADIYSLGCVLYHCLTGQPPFPDTQMLDQITRHIQEEPRPVQELNPDVPDGLQQVLNRMMAKDPAQRFPTPGQAARTLQPFQQGVPKLTRPTEDVMAEKRPNPRPGSDIPVGKLVGKGEKPAVPKAKAPAPDPLPTPPLPIGRPASPPAVAQPAGDYDVELVAIPCPPPGAPRKARDQRSLLDLDRRDFVMLGAGVGGSLFAILLGLSVARMLQGKPDSPEPPAE